MKFFDRFEELMMPTWIITCSIAVLGLVLGRLVFGVLLAIVLLGAIGFGILSWTLITLAKIEKEAIIEAARIAAEENHEPPITGTP